MDHLPITIRPATRKDYPSIISLYGKFVENNKRYTSRKNDSFSAVLKDPDCHIDLAIYKKEITGFISYSIRPVIRYPRPVLEVEEFFVLEKYRRMKIGTLLMDHVTAICHKRHCHAIFLGSSKERIPAHAFYKKRGFAEYGFHYRKIF
jgi:GNAT superfamily N-acetyltransferase